MSKSSASSKADTAVKLVMIFFISLLSFSVGTYVGKQVSDSDYRRAALESDYKGGHVAETDMAQSEADAATQPITEEEVASLTEEFVKKEEREIASAEAPNDEPTTTPPTEAKTEDGYTHHSKLKANYHEEAIAHADGKPSEPAPAPTVSKSAPAAEKPAPAPAPKATPTAGLQKAAERVASDMAPAADPKKVREPSAVLPTVATTAIGKYTVQVASYATETEAKDQAAKLTGKGYSAFYIPATVNGKVWYRVSVGLFSDQKSATNYRTELLATQAVNSAIVQKIVK